ncbi:glycosyltransferase family 2 protein [Kocuria rhizosphaericola]|uniref:glycosyltransferase family 2 protein n=1 Tax=Kocuria rhizosphaericola TaxID=3376284 RepID=UPI0037BABD2C
MGQQKPGHAYQPNCGLGCFTTMPKYTVVMPARDANQTIEAAIRSVLASFPKDLQIVVWDDGSTDNTAEVAGQIDPRKILVMSSESSVGGGVARQRILASSDSEFVVNQDADDISLPWRHRIQSSILVKADFAFTGVRRFSDRKLFHRPSLPLPYTPKDAQTALLLHNPLSHPSMVARRKALDEIGGYSDTKVAQDYELWLRAVLHGKRLSRSGIPCLSYRLSSSQVSQQEDYSSRVLGNQKLLNSYGNLAEKLIPAYRPRHEPIGTVEDLGHIDPCSIKQLISNMSPTLRPYYRHLLQNRRLGYLSEAVIGDSRQIDA